MKETILRQATKFENIKEIIYNSVKMYPNHVAFVTKKIKEKGIEYIKHYLEHLFHQAFSYM